MNHTASHFKTRKQYLETVSVILKKEFIGLDEVIDEIIQLVSPWFFHPQHQTRPTIINLWGMTGVGKTSLVNRLTELLDFTDHYYAIDMGESSGNFDSFYSFFRQMAKAFPGQPFILGLDEFQYANTKDQDGNELQKTYCRAIWDILDTGSFKLFNDGYYREELLDIIDELKFYLSKGVEVEQGLIVKNADYYLAMEEAKSGREFGLPEVPDKNHLSFVKPAYLRTIHIGYPIFRHIVELKDHLFTLDGRETISFLESILLKLQNRQPLDCSKALVFIMGNLDEAYYFASELNPDIAADEFYRKSRQININHIKAALKQRFRNEQIARLGNNHIIYPAFSKQSFEKIISAELDKIAAGVQNHFGIALTFHRSARKLVYDEGVFPAQGTRPVLSTIQHIVETQVSHIPAIIEEHVPGAEKVIMKYAKGKIILDFMDDKGAVLYSLKKELRLKLKELRKNRKDSLQAITAVHECGHAIASTLLMGMLPGQIFSICSETSTAGMMISEPGERIIWQQKSIMAKASVCLAGMAAEKLVFGEEHITAGSESDIIFATHLISSLIKKQGLAGKPYAVDVEHAMHNGSVYDRDNNFNRQIQEYLDIAFKEAEAILKKHYPLLLDASRVLANQPLMTKEQFLKLLAKHAPGNQPEQLIPVSTDYRDLLFGENAEKDNPLNRPIPLKQAKPDEAA